MASNVIIRLVGATTKLSTIAKIRKYKKLHERHHFIIMAMEVHNTPRCDMDRFIKECAYLFHDKRSGGHLYLSFNIQFSRQHVNISFQCALTSTIERKIVLANDVCSRALITIRFHDLHASDIIGVMGEIISYHDKD